eukprot:8503028-Alexandrium_andersonii.AAC.1
MHYLAGHLLCLGPLRLQLGLQVSESDAEMQQLMLPLSESFPHALSTGRASDQPRTHARHALSTEAI